MRACYLMNWDRGGIPLEHPRARPVPEGIKEIEAIKKELGGENYLQKEKDRQKDLSKEIIIAIENQKII